MDHSSFDAAYWEHWLLVVCSVGMAIGGLWLSWQWNRELRDRRKRSQLARHLAMELHAKVPCPAEKLPERLSEGSSSAKSSKVPSEEAEGRLSMMRSPAGSHPKFYR